jgi:hypothetical protein
MRSKGGTKVIGMFRAKGKGGGTLRLALKERSDDASRIGAGMELAERLLGSMLFASWFLT